MQNHIFIDPSFSFLIPNYLSIIETQQTSFTPKITTNKFTARNNRATPYKITPSITALQTLHQIKQIQPIEYELQDERGPAHQPLFTMCLKITVNNEVLSFQGEGSSKKIAKLNSAENALRYLVNLNNFLHPNDRMAIRNSLFSNVVEPTNETIYKSFEPNITHEKCIEQEPKSQEMKDENNYLKFKDKNPISVLNELTQSKYKYVFELIKDKNDEGLVFFEYKLVIIQDGSGESKEFVSNGSSKKEAKTRCAQLALECLFNVKIDTETLNNDESNNDPNIPKNFKHEFANKIVELIQNEYNSLKKSIRSDNEDQNSELKSMVKNRSVYASIAQTINFDLSTLKLICITTGTKCISGEHMSELGLTLNDCHAEILAVRVLRKYFYEELLRIITNPEETNSIFECSQTKQLYCLKKDIKFHLFISTSPCGDGRIFSPHENSKNFELDLHPNRKIRGLLRTKIESGEGTIPTRSNDFIQTWDGILGGERLRVMSCSDKLCKLNIVGVQGALLSHFIEPIYFSSLIIGSFFHRNHLIRALYGRIEEKIKDSLSNGYRINKPILSSITNLESRKLSKSANKSMIWLLNKNEFEIINCKSGKQINEKQSSICKQELFRLWINIANLLKDKNFELKIENPSEVTYADAKKIAVAYQQMKLNLYKTFRDSSLGTWLSKPFEQNYFNLH